MRIITPSKFFESGDNENCLFPVVAIIGAPLVACEKILSGNEVIGAIQALEDLYNVNKYQNGQLWHKNGVEIIQRDGLSYVDSYQATRGDKHESDMGKKGSWSFEL